MPYTESETSSGLLTPYRALDLTDHNGFLCGKILGDLGADVIKVEPPGGDPSRNIGPFYQDISDPEKSLFWFAYNTSKRGITLNIESSEGQELFRKLVQASDLVLESFSPGHMDSLALDYSSLKKVNPKIIMVSITHFGQTGPYCEYKGSDLITMAMSGQVFICGDADRPPVRISYPQACFHGSADGAAAAMIALFNRQRTGEGQHVDVSMQEAATWTMMNAAYHWYTNKHLIVREGVYRLRPGLNTLERTNWPCRDGWVCFTVAGGDIGKRDMEGIGNWLESEGMGDDFIKNTNWGEVDFSKLTQDIIDRAEKPISELFAKHTKAELYEGALKWRVALFPINSAKDIAEDVQLKARNFWVAVKHPELGVSITYPGAYARAAPEAWHISRRAPFIGEHNKEIYVNELGMTISEYNELKQKNII